MLTSHHHESPIFPKAIVINCAFNIRVQTLSGVSEAPTDLRGFDSRILLLLEVDLHRLLEPCGVSTGGGGGLSST